MAKDHSSSLSLALPIARGGYVARFAASDADRLRVGQLRHQCFVLDAGRAALAGGIETDGFDDQCDHVMIDNTDGDLVCCFRVLALESGAALHMSYSSQYYDLSNLLGFGAPMVELGRFCVATDVTDPDVLRIAWGALAAYVDALGAEMLFGCSSFAGVDPAAYGAAFDLLAARHLMPEGWHIGVKSTDVVPFGDLAGPVQDRRHAMAQVPPLLKTYLSMGGWVSAHTVIDAEMNTLHVFTGLEIAAIPSGRAKALRAIAT